MGVVIFRRELHLSLDLVLVQHSYQFLILHVLCILTEGGDFPTRYSYRNECLVCRPKFSFLCKKSMYSTEFGIAFIMYFKYLCVEQREMVKEE